MPASKKQLMRLVRLAAQLKENRYPNCTSFAEEMRKADLDENLNLACSPRTVYRDIQTLKTEFGAPIRFDATRNGYYLAHHGWTFSCPCVEDDEMLAAVLGARIAEHIFPSPLRERIRRVADSLLTENNPDFLDHAQIDSLTIDPRIGLRSTRVFLSRCFRHGRITKYAASHTGAAIATSPNANSSHMPSFFTMECGMPKAFAT